MKRRWLRISLRTTLIVLTILCVWLSWHAHRAKEQKVAVNWVLKNGGQVLYTSEYEHGNQPSVRGTPSFVSKWLIEMLGVDYFSSVAEVFGFRADLSDVTPLAALKNLESVSVDGTQVSDLRPLSNLTKLEYLSLSNTRVNDVKPLAGLAQLQDLHLDATQVSDLTPLSGLTRLKRLYLCSSKISDLRPLANLAKLDTLSLIFTRSSDATPLAGLSNLKELYLNNTQVNEVQIKSLQQALPKCNIKYRPIVTKANRGNGE